MKEYIIQYTTDNNKYPKSRPAELTITDNSIRGALSRGAITLNFDYPDGYEILSARRVDICYE